MVEKKKRGKCKCGEYLSKVRFFKVCTAAAAAACFLVSTHTHKSHSSPALLLLIIAIRYYNKYHHLSSLSFLLRYLICYQSPVTTKEIRLDEDVAVTLK